MAAKGQNHLFGKLRKHELELGHLNEQEDKGRKKNIMFKKLRL